MVQKYIPYRFTLAEKIQIAMTALVLAVGLVGGVMYFITSVTGGN